MTKRPTRAKMRTTEDSQRGARFPAALVALAALLSLGLLAAAPASAAYEEVGTFAGILEAPAEAGVFPEEMQLGSTGGIAVNYTGAGGVPKGTLYATSNQSGLRIARYKPGGESMSFVEAWEVTQEEGPYEHCGPLLVIHCSPRPGVSGADVDVDVDQTTGNVYVLDTRSFETAIVEYSPDGSKVIARFGTWAASGKTAAETPSQIHSSQVGGIAVNGAGEVYVYDNDGPSDNFYHRLMVFRPESPGDYAHYEYAGEIAAGFFSLLPDERPPTLPVFDAAGHVYVADFEGGVIRELVSEEPSGYPAPHATSLCSFTYTKEGITSFTVNPTSGDPFFFSYKKEAGAFGKNVKHVHQLGPCNEATHKFEAGGKEEVGKFEVRPERGELYAMAYDPGRKLPVSSAAARPAGAIYGAAPSGEPDLATGGEPELRSLGYVFAPTSGAAKFKLTVTKSGTGKGTVISYPVGIACGTAFCATEFEEGKEVELKAAAAAGSEFLKWTGACTGTGACKVTMSEAKAVTAEFKLKFKLTVTKPGTGPGTVTSTPAGINCGSGAGCEAEFTEGTEVTLSQAAASGSEFKEWTGACTGSGACKVTMSAAKSVGAVFTLIPRQLLDHQSGNRQRRSQMQSGSRLRRTLRRLLPQRHRAQSRSHRQPRLDLRRLQRRHRLGGELLHVALQLHDRSQQLSDRDLQHRDQTEIQTHRLQVGKRHRHRDEFPERHQLRLRRGL